MVVVMAVVASFRRVNKPNTSNDWYKIDSITLKWSPFSLSQHPLDYPPQPLLPSLVFPLPCARRPACVGALALLSGVLFAASDVGHQDAGVATAQDGLRPAVFSLEVWIL